MAAPTKWILSGSDFGDTAEFFLHPQSPGNRVRALAAGGYMLQDQPRIGFSNGYKRSTYKKCVRVWTFDFDGGSTYALRAIFKMPGLVETTSHIAISGATAAAIASSFGLSPTVVGVLAIYVCFFGQRYTRFGDPGAPWHIYPTNNDANSIAIAFSAYFQ